MNNVERCICCKALVFKWDLKDHMDWHADLGSELIRLEGH